MLSLTSEDIDMKTIEQIVEKAKTPSLRPIERQISDHFNEIRFKKMEKFKQLELSQPPTLLPAVDVECKKTL